MAKHEGENNTDVSRSKTKEAVSPVKETPPSLPAVQEN
jgi:hypothetical protein